MTEPEQLATSAPPTVYLQSNLTRFNPFPAARAAGTPLSNYQYMVSMHMTSHGMKRLPTVGSPPPATGGSGSMAGMPM
jgi:hypothetical protein